MFAHNKTSLALCALLATTTNFDVQQQVHADPQVPRELIREALSIPERDLTPARFRRMPVPNSGFENSDYMNEVRAASRGMTLRFSRMPIPVYIDSSGQPDLVPIWAAALNRWQTMSNEMVRFVMVPSPEQARIIVRPHHQGFNPSGTPKGAVTHLDWKLRNGHRQQPVNGVDDGSQYLVPSQIIDVNLDVAADRTPEQRTILLTNIFCHELGHALGILGHSPVESDLMYKETDEYSRLSERDLNTLKKLYQSKVDVQL